MKNYLLILFAIGFLATGCKDDDTGEVTPPVYTVQIMSPNADDKMVGDSIHIHVNFDEANQETIHHVKVTITNKADSTVLYTGPSAAHVHEETGHYEYHDDVALNVDAGTEWILEAKVWGHEAGLAEVAETVEFKVN